MFTHRVFFAALLAVLLLCGMVWSQHNLPIPVNHTATGTAIGVNSDGSTYNVWLFNAKDQPSEPLGPNAYKRAYWHASSISASLTQEWMRNINQQPLTLPLYPSVIANGGRVDQDFWTKAVAALHSPERFTAWVSGNNWYWSDVTPQQPWATEPITCATTGKWEAGASWNVVVGLDRIGDVTADHYFERSSTGGATWLPVPNSGDNVLPVNLAMTDVVIEDLELPNKLLSVSTPALHLTQNGELPLITDHVVSNRVCYTHNLREQTPRWFSFDPAPGDELWNLQIAMKNDQVYGLAYNADENTSVVFLASFANELIEDWAPVEMNPQHPLPAAIPYDLEAVANHSLLATSAAGLYYSTDDGASWYPVSDEIRTPELRQMSIQKVENDQFKIVLAGWYSSYVGTFDTTTWQFNLQEISYDPATLDLYQSRNQAWSGLSLVENNDFVDFALIDYSANPYYANDSAVVVQVDMPDAAPKNVFLGYQDHGTRPFLFSEGNPAVVFNRQGTAGPMVMETPEPPYLNWMEYPLFNDPQETIAEIYAIAERPGARFISLRNVGTTDRIWRNLGQGWEAAGCNGLTDFTQGYIAATQGGVLYYLCTLGPNFLNLSTDNGSNFVEIPGPSHGWDTEILSISVGYDAGMPLYVCGKAWTDEGRIYRRDVDGTYSESLWGAGYGVITKVAADPYAPDFSWIHTRDVNNGVSRLWCLYFRSEYAADKVLLWQGAAGTDSVRDLQIIPTDEYGRVLDMTLMTPNSNEQGTDHTVIKRWQLNILTPDVTFPTTMNGQWIVAGEVTIPSEQTLTIERKTSLLFLPGAKLIVDGSLQAEGELGEEIVFEKAASDQSELWEGIEVNGSANLNYCILRGAKTGLMYSKAGEMSLTNCTFENNEFGMNIYAPEGSGPVDISSCTFTENEKTAIELVGTYGATLSECRFEHNGGDGISMSYSFATISQSDFIENGSFGLECFGSSPVVYCNSFTNDAAGEMGLWNESYPILWDAEGQNGGANSFLNDNMTLITMESSSPIVEKGMNDFYVGSTGYFMADVSKDPIEHILDGNYWNPDLTINLLYPSDPKYWIWGGVESSPSDCNTPKESLDAGVATLFESALTAELSSDVTTAQTLYTQIMTQYSDTLWAILAAARLFETQRQADTLYATLQSFLWNFADAHPTDTLLANAARALATRLWVEAGDFDPALTAYQQTLVNPSTPVDSAYAAMDYALTVLQAQYEDSGGRGTLDSYGPTACTASIADLLGAVHSTLPKAPLTQHAGYRILPTNFVLEQNYPNPFNARTAIRYYLPEANKVQVEIYNIAGQHVATLTDGLETEGYHTVQWDASSAASGVYVYQIKAGNFVDSKKMVLIR